MYLTRRRFFFAYIHIYTYIHTYIYVYTYIYKYMANVDLFNSFRAAITDLKAEQKCWITKSNMNDKITPELFEKPRTTGLVAKHRLE